MSWTVQGWKTYKECSNCDNWDYHRNFCSKECLVMYKHIQNDNCYIHCRLNCRLK